MAVIVETDTWKTGEHSHGEPLCYIVHGSNNEGGGTPGKTGGHRHKILNHTKYLIAKM